MPVVDLSFVTDDSKEVIFVQHIRARVPLVRWISYSTLRQVFGTSLTGRVPAQQLSPYSSLSLFQPRSRRTWCMAPCSSWRGALLACLSSSRQSCLPFGVRISKRHSLVTFETRCTIQLRRTLNWMLRTGGSSRMLSCFVTCCNSARQIECVWARGDVQPTCGICLHLLQLYSFEPSVSGFVNLLRHDPSVASASLSPSTSRLISNIGSTVDVTFPHLSHFTSLCS